MASARRVSDTETIGPIVVYAWFWVGLAIAHALFGNLWATISPLDTIGRLVTFDEEDEPPARRYPAAWGKWPAAIQLFGFVWVELVQPFRSIPGHLGLLIVVYALIQIAGVARSAVGSGSRTGKRSPSTSDSSRGWHRSLVTRKDGSCSGRSSPGSRRSLLSPDCSR